MRKLELYTRPTCSDCQAAKVYLKEQGIPFKEYDLSKQPEKEKDLIRVSGARVVPAFVFYHSSFLKRLQKPQVFIGFENNLSELRKIFFGI